MRFTVVTNESLFERMRLEVIVRGIKFSELMVKLSHCDNSWRESL